jgi:hypothetical protein
VIEGPDAADLKAAFDRLGPQPGADTVEDLARKARQARRKRLAEMYVAVDPARQALIGWAVDPDDVPAFNRPGSAGPPSNPEPNERLNAERAFHEWLASQRYTADWAALNEIENPAVRTAASGFREIARAYSEAFR